MLRRPSSSDLLVDFPRGRQKISSVPGSKAVPPSYYQVPMEKEFIPMAHHVAPCFCPLAGKRTASLFSVHTFWSLARHRFAPGAPSFPLSTGATLTGSFAPFCPKSRNLPLCVTSHMPSVEARHRSSRSLVLPGLSWLRPVFGIPLLFAVMLKCLGR